MSTSILPSQQRGPGSSHTLPTTNTASAQILASKHHGLLCKPGLHREMADFRAFMGKGQFETERLFVPKDKEVFKE